MEISQHPDAEKLYVEKIDLGEPTPRTIVSGEYTVGVCFGSILIRSVIRTFRIRIPNKDSVENR